MFEKILDVLTQEEKKNHVQIIETNLDKQYIRFYVISDAPSPNPDCMIYVDNDIIYEGVDYDFDENDVIITDDMINFNSFDEWKQDFIEDIYYYLDEDAEADDVYFNSENPEVVFIEIQDGKVVNAYCNNLEIEQVYVFNSNSSNPTNEKNLKKVKSEIPEILIVEE